MGWWVAAVHLQDSYARGLTPQQLSSKLRTYAAWNRTDRARKECLLCTAQASPGMRAAECAATSGAWALHGRCGTHLCCSEQWRAVWCPEGLHHGDHLLAQSAIGAQHQGVVPPGPVTAQQYGSGQ